MHQDGHRSYIGAKDLPTPDHVPGLLARVCKRKHPVASTPTQTCCFLAGNEGTPRFIPNPWVSPHRAPASKNQHNSNPRFESGAGQHDRVSRTIDSDRDGLPWYAAMPAFPLYHPREKKGKTCFKKAPDPSLYNGNEDLALHVCWFGA